MQKLDIPKEKDRIDKELAAVEQDLERSRAKLANESFISRAPAAIVEKERAFAWTGGGDGPAPPVDEAT